MKVQRVSATMLNFLALFTGGALLVLLWVTLESLFIKRLTLSYLIQFSLPATGVLLLGMIGLLMLYVWIRLKRLQKMGIGSGGGAPDREDQICRSLLRLPSELFWLTVAYGGLFIPVYHVVHYLVEGHSLVRIGEDYWLNFIRSFLYEQTIALSAAILHYAVARRLIRPMLLSLSQVRGEKWLNKSFLSMLTTTFAGLLLVNLFSILWYVMVALAKGTSIELTVLGPLIVIDLVFAASIFILLAFEFRRELQMLIGSIRDWLKGDRSLLHSRMPILSHDEVGQLAMVFNRLQDQVHREYEGVKKELQMARQVQLQLLPSADHLIKGYEIQALSRSHHPIGNGFYDVASRTNDGFAAVVGEIRGSGMPAALQMSAAQLLLRAEMEQESTQAPEEMLGRWREGLQEVFPQEDPISLVLIVVDTQRNVLRAASQGHMNAQRIRAGQLEPLIFGDEMSIDPGDQLLLYSKPALEAAHAIASECYGQVEQQLPLEEQLRSWTNSFMDRFVSVEEDFTLLLIRRSETGARGE